MSPIIHGLQVKYVAIGKLKPNEKNARKHTVKQINQIADSIKNFGWTIPILVDEGLQVLAGHARLSAAALLEVPEVPVIQIDDLTPAQKRAYMLADNKLTLNAAWDDDLLKDELLAIEKDDFDLLLTGFSQEEIDFALDRIPLGDDGVETTPERPTCRNGDIWLLGDHRLSVGPNNLKAADQTIESWQGYTEEEATFGTPEGPIFKNVRKARKDGLEVKIE